MKRKDKIIGPHYRVFTDGAAFEHRVTKKPLHGIGGLILDPENKFFTAFSLAVEFQYRNNVYAEVAAAAEALRLIPVGSSVQICFDYTGIKTAADQRRNGCWQIRHNSNMGDVYTELFTAAAQHKEIHWKTMKCEDGKYAKAVHYFSRAAALGHTNELERFTKFIQEKIINCKREEKKTGRYEKILEATRLIIQASVDIAA